MRKIYLCNSCKKTGIKTSKAMLFESFSCPRCKKDTTLFLKPDEKIKNNLLIKEEFNINSTSKPVEPVEPVAQVVRQVEPKINNNSTLKVVNGRLFYFRDVILFLIGFIAALLIMKK